jgi:hypothetical protein
MLRLGTRTVNQRDLPFGCLCRDAEGATHTVHVQGSSLFEAAARAVAAFREQEWAGRKR